MSNKHPNDLLIMQALVALLTLVSVGNPAAKNKIITDITKELIERIAEGAQEG